MSTEPKRLTGRPLTGRPLTGRPLTGRKVLAITLLFFGVILAANLTMLFAATGTFPGLVVKNSYVASQDWNAKTDAQRALGWRAQAAYSQGALRVVMSGPDGAPVTGLDVVAVVGRPASARDDVRLDLAEGAEGYTAPLVLEPGLWHISIEGSDPQGRVFEAEAEFQVADPA
jgi:nitrogen fixation protein FixH